MAKLKFNTDQYNDLKRFVALYAQRFYYDVGAPTGGDVITALEEMEKKTPSQAAEGLMMMINDSIEMSSGWHPEKIAAFDAELKANGISTLTDLRRQYSRQYARVIKRGQIKNLDEYYLLKGVLDGGSLEITLDEQTTLTQMLCIFEDKFAKANATNK
jgi:hypothetical protein